MAIERSHTPQVQATFLWRVLIIVLTTWGFVCTAPEFARIFNDYGTLGFEANNDGQITSVRGPPATDGGLHPNDVIDLQRTSLRDRLAVFAGMGGMTYVRPDLQVTLYVWPAQSDRTNRSATPHVLRARAHSTTQANELLLFLTTTLGVLSIALGAVLVWQRPNTMTWGFFLYIVWFNPGLNFVFYAELQRFPYLVLVQELLQAATEAAGYAGFIAFALRFPRNVVDSAWRPVEAALPGVIAVLFVLHLGIFGTALGFATEAVSRWSYYLGYLVPISVLLILRFRQRNQTPTDRQRTRWVHLACRVGLFAFIFVDSNMSTTLWRLLVQPFCTAHSVLALTICDNDRLSETTLLSLLTLNATIPVAIFHAIRHHRAVCTSLLPVRFSSMCCW